jgi:hypothetical protein
MHPAAGDRLAGSSPVVVVATATEAGELEEDTPGLRCDNGCGHDTL